MPKPKANQATEQRRKRQARQRASKFLDIYGVALSLRSGHPDSLTIASMTDGEMFAIGMLTVQWAYLEHQLLADTAQMANRARWKELPSDATSLSFKRRLSAWRDTIQSTVKNSKKRARLLKLHDRIANAESLRHKITHGLWQWFPSSPDRLRAYSFRPQVAFQEDHLSFDKLIKLAQRIGQINYELAYPPTKADRRKRHYRDFIRAAGGEYINRRFLLELMGRDHTFERPLRAPPPTDQVWNNTAQHLQQIISSEPAPSESSPVASSPRRRPRKTHRI
jgi:hypothetical protein